MSLRRSSFKEMHGQHVPDVEAGPEVLRCLVPSCATTGHLQSCVSASRCQRPKHHKLLWHWLTVCAVQMPAVVLYMRRGSDARSLRFFQPTEFAHPVRLRFALFLAQTVDACLSGDSVRLCSDWRDALHGAIPQSSSQHRLSGLHWAKLRRGPASQCRIRSQ